MEMVGVESGADLCEDQSFFSTFDTRGSVPHCRSTQYFYHILREIRGH